MPSAFRGDGSGNGESQWSPSADISESKKEYLVKANLPDVDRSDIDVSVEDGVLTIKGERKHSKEEDDETLHRVETFYGEFLRSFSLPSSVDASNIKAEYKKGVLRVHLPKTKESEKLAPTRIEIS